MSSSRPAPLADGLRQRLVWVRAVGLAALCGVAASAQPVSSESVTVGAAVTGKVGTHENALGVALGASAPLPLGLAREHAAFVRATAGVEALVQDLGLPGRSLGAQASLEAGYAFGARRPYPSADGYGPRPRAHTLAYSLVAYLDSDGTSQLSGALRYQYAGPSASLDVQFENDALAHQLLDRYRTFALRVRYLRRDGDVPVGAGLRAVVWTGTTEGLGRLGRDESYDLSGQHGGAYAHGILALDLYRGDVTLSVGVDSEGVRSTLQNSFHYLIDDGQIPRLEDRPPRLFLRLALHEVGGLY